MQRFHCHCGQELFFENVQCVQCERTVGFAPTRLAMEALDGDGPTYTLARAPEAGAWRSCANYDARGVCNWLVPADEDARYCASCRLDRTIPDLGMPANIALWARTEAAKRRLLYTLLALGLPFAPDDPRADPPLAFDILAETPGCHVTTGHDGGLVTLALAEADEAARTRIREQFGETYRTLLGHLRHESGHYFFATLVEGTRWHAPFRAHFGDETADYAAALARHYAAGAPSEWTADHVSAYVSAHPHEDWAETWAHYLHIRDTLETARAYGLSVADADELPESRDRDFARIVAAWTPVTVAVNALNRSMGQPDMYPFVLPAPAVAKLQFVHEVVRAGV
jgi:hypothetical protein